MIIKARWKCKSGSQIAHSMSGPWIDRYITGKWYDVEYETWSWESGYRVNGGWRKYWAINEQGEKEELSKPEAKCIFFHDIDMQRDAKIDLILNE